MRGLLPLAKWVGIWVVLDIGVFGIDKAWGLHLNGTFLVTLAFVLVGVLYWADQHARRLMH